MKKGVYENIIRKFEKFKKGLPYLEKALKSKKTKEIDRAIAYNFFLLHRIHKKATKKSTDRSIRELTEALWWFKHKKDEKERKYIKVKKQYTKWAKKYDIETNVAIFLEEKSVKDFLPKIKGKDVLDLGCGTGRHAIRLAKKGANVTCVDMTQAMLSEAKKKAKKAKVDIKVKRQDITKFKPDKKYDLIILMLVLDHIQKLEKAIKVINKASEIGTEVIISNIHPETMRGDANFKPGARAKGYLVEGFKTDQFYHPIEEYIDLFMKYGFILEKIKDLTVTEKDLKSRKMSEFKSLKGRTLMLLMKFKKIK